MSRIYFHAPSGEVELYGTERHWMGNLVHDIGAAILDPADHVDQLLQYLPADHYVRSVLRDPVGSAIRFARDFNNALHGDFGELLRWRGRGISAFSLVLNTVLLVGNDPMKLLARLHGQCELHCWVDGANRAWLADIIERGVSSGLYRDAHPQGDDTHNWSSVVAFLRTRDDEPVVTSYSVCESFPNASASDWIPWPEGTPRDYSALTKAQQEEVDHLSETWYDLSKAEQWDHGMRWLREHEAEKWLELRPGNWSSFHFGHGLTAFDLIAADSEIRLERALGK